MSKDQSLPRGTLLGFDFGQRRIGVATGEIDPATAAPLATVACHQNTPDWAAIDKLIAEWRPVRLLVGLPHRADGTEGSMAPQCREFATALGRRSGIAVELVDESLSSRSAAAELREHRRSGRMQRRVRRGDTDRIAARLIVETWLANRTSCQ
ncbi:MAG: Holliday junction resolvase RuvX [Gammaproteobacteria bacterium]|nr:Holliday junction resolvase RuvX [Gammaproteobacteria bacterium]